MAETQTPRWRIPWAEFGNYVGLIVAIVALVIFFSLKTDHFLSRITFQTIANQVPAAIILAVGMTFVLIIGGIDLSVGSVLALSSAVLGLAMVRWQLPLPVAMLLAVATGLLCGVLNGAISVAWRLPSFIVTLGMLEMARGATYLVSNSQTQYIGSRVEVIADLKLGGISVAFLVALALVTVAQFGLTRTVFGRHLVAIGTNEEAVRLAGINPRPLKLLVFALCGLLAGVAAVIETARLASADPNAGQGYELQAIAAVVVGGTSLMGGRGSVACSCCGVLLISILAAGLVQVGAQEPTKRLITGGVIIAAVVLDHYRQRLRAAQAVGKETPC